MDVSDLLCPANTGASTTSSQVSRAPGSALIRGNSCYLDLLQSSCLYARCPQKMQSLPRRYGELPSGWVPTWVKILETLTVTGGREDRLCLRTRSDSTSQPYFLEK